MSRKKGKSREKSAKIGTDDASRKRALPNYVLAFLLGAVPTVGAFFPFDMDSSAGSRQRSSSVGVVSKTYSIAGKRNVNQLLALPEGELEKVDILELNLATACEIPGLEKLDYGHYRRMVDKWTAQFAQWLPTVEKEIFQPSPDKWRNDINFLRSGLLCLYPTQEVGVWYVEKYSKDQKQGKMCRYADSGALFLHGLIETKRRTCASMPNLHITIGRRMGWPVSSACLHSHYICRYDDGKVHYNIEGTYTGPGFVCDSDEEYMKANSLSKRAKASGSDFRSLSAREILGAFISARARHYRDTNRPGLADRDYAESRALFPKHRYVYVESIRPLTRGLRTQHADGPNLYQYVGSNPINYADPSGLFRKYVCCNQNQINKIKQDEARALQQIQALQAQINAAIAADKGQYPALIGSALKKSVIYLDTAADVIRNKDVKCEPQGALKPCNAGAIAWQKWIFARTVHLCPIYLGPRYGPNFRASTLVHEGTHFAGTLDVRYFTHHQEWPHKVGLTGWHDIASTYDTWILCGFCIPGHNCVGRPSRVNENR